MTEARTGDGGGPQDGGGGPGGPLRRTVRVVNPRGLHPRIIDLFVKTAKGFTSTVTLQYGEMRADGTSVWDLIMLVVMPDTEVVLEVAGPDGAAALDRLAAILAAPGGEDYTI